MHVFYYAYAGDLQMPGRWIASRSVLHVYILVSQSLSFRLSGAVQRTLLSHTNVHCGQVVTLHHMHVNACVGVCRCVPVSNNIPLCVSA